MESKGNANVNAVYEFNKEEAHKFKPKAHDLRQVIADSAISSLTFCLNRSNKEKYIYLKYKLRAFVESSTLPAENKVTPVAEGTTNNIRGTVTSGPEKLLDDIYMEGTVL